MQQYILKEFDDHRDADDAQYNLNNQKLIDSRLVIFIIIVIGIYIYIYIYMCVCMYVLMYTCIYINI